MPGRVPPRRAAAAAAAAAGGGKRACIVLPGLGNAAGDYAPLRELLEARGHPTKVLDVKRYDWARNALGLRDPAWWRGVLEPRPVVDWYLDYIRQAVEELRGAGHAENGLAFVSHSAGGWLGRVFLLECMSPAESGVDTMLCLGSPNLAAPEGATGIVDQTRGLLTYVNDRSPGAFHDEVKYVTVVGKYVQGAYLRDGINNDLEATVEQKVVGQGYKQLCGDAKVWGDGIVPIANAHLEGAEQVELDGVYHSPLGQKEGAVWYGSPEVVDRWVGYLA